VDFAGRAERADGASDKVALTRAGLRLRRRDPDLFAHGAYVPLATAGRHADRVIAFARVHEGRWALAAVSRLTEGVEDWGDTRVVLPDAAPVAEIPAADLFADLPAALLTPE
jgi:(1->4)-alpha-D-glucan 1-alpha-D-glucosylmutase